MSQPSRDICPECTAELRSGTSRCPGCGVELVRCSSGRCALYYPAAMAGCPFCGTPKVRLQPASRFSADPAVPPEADLGPEIEPAIMKAIREAILSGQPSPPLPAIAGSNAEESRPAVPSPSRVPSRVSILEEALAPLGNLSVPLLAASSPTPVALEIEVGRTPRRDRLGSLMLRALGSGLTETAAVTVYLQANWWPTPQVLHATLAPGQTQDCLPLEFVPHLSGGHRVRAVVTLHDGAGLPTGRWTGSHEILVDENTDQPVGSIWADKGAVVIVSHPQYMPPALTLPAADGGLPIWLRLMLQHDRSFDRRLGLACPEAPRAPVGLEPATWPTDPGVLRGAVELRDLQAGHRHTIDVACGAVAGLGREVDDDVSWCLKPYPYDERQAHRLSRLHLTIELRDGRAWVVDRSTNHTWLNGEPLPKGHAELLAEGDLLEPAQVLGLRVHLAATQGSVDAAWLERNDGPAGPHRYLLLGRPGPVPVALGPGGPPALWLGWRAGSPPPQLAACAADGGGWLGVTPEGQTLAQRYRLTWRPRDRDPGRQETRATMQPLPPPPMKSRGDPPPIRITRRLRPDEQRST